MPAGRPRKVAPEEALEKAMKLFWRKGYDATSISDLVEETGMVKASLYKVFRDKKGLYEQALGHYNDNLSVPWINGLLQSKSSVKETIKRYLTDIANASLNAERPSGCFMVNTSVECASTAPDLGNLSSGYHDIRRQAFLKYFQDAIQKGKIEARYTPEELAEFFSDQTILLASLAKAGADRKRYDTYVKMAMEILD